MAEAQHHQVLTNITVPVEALVEAAGRPQVNERSLEGKRNAKKAMFARVGPGSVVDVSKLPKGRFEKLMLGEPALRPLAAKPEERELPPNPPATAVHTAKADVEQGVAEVDTSPAARKKARRTKKPPAKAKE